MAETIHLAIPAAGSAYEFYARVTAESAKRGSSLPVKVHFIGDEDFKCVLSSTSPHLHGATPIGYNSFAAWHGSSITWSRLWLPELFPELDWIISTDADILFRGDIADLWNLRPTTTTSNYNFIPWVLPSRDCPMPGEPYNKKAIDWYRAQGLTFEHPEEYFCAGLAIFNLKAMREGGWAQMRDAFLAAHDMRTMPNADQCVLNYLLQDKKQLLPRGWGVFSGDENVDIDWSKPGAVHFVEDMPWKRSKITHLESDLVVEWKKLANELGGHYRWHNWRRLAFVFLKHNPWILKLNYGLWIHLRSTRGIH